MWNWHLFLACSASLQRKWINIDDTNGFGRKSSSLWNFRQLRIHVDIKWLAIIFTGFIHCKIYIIYIYGSVMTMVTAVHKYCSYLSLPLSILRWKLHGALQCNMNLLNINFLNIDIHILKGHLPWTVYTIQYNLIHAQLLSEQFIPEHQKNYIGKIMNWNSAKVHIFLLQKMWWKSLSVGILPPWSCRNKLQ